MIESRDSISQSDDFQLCSRFKRQVAEQGARANADIRHASCLRTSRAGCRRGSSLTFGKEMSWRRKELARYSGNLTWLSEDQARAVFARAGVSRKRYGLDEDIWDISERWDVEKTGQRATRAKLARLIVDEEFFLVFGRADVCRVSRSLFLDEWQNMFGPARDDLMIMPDSDSWGLFYCHEDEFEAGWRKKPNKAPEPTTRSVTPRATERESR